VALTVFQALPLDGLVIVTSPQELVSQIVEKAVKMANMMNVPIIGLVENMSYFECPDCGRQHKIFGESHVDEVAFRYGIPAVAKLPINPKIAGACDRGLIELFEGDWLDVMVDVCLAAYNPNKRDGMPEAPEGCSGSCDSCGVEGCGSRQ
jgi:hypothetical protein